VNFISPTESEFRPGINRWETRKLLCAAAKKIQIMQDVYEKLNSQISLRVYRTSFLCSYMILNLYFTTRAHIPYSVLKLKIWSTVWYLCTFK